MVLCWYHAGGEGPTYEVPGVSEEDDPAFSDAIVYRTELVASLQDMAENNVDYTHFHFVHGREALNDSTSQFSTDGPFSTVIESFEAEDLVFTRYTYGPGIALLRVPGLMTIFTATTAIDRRHVRLLWHFYLPTELVGVAEDIIDGVTGAHGLNADVPIWRDKVFLGQAPAGEGRRAHPGVPPLVRPVLRGQLRRGRPPPHREHGPMRLSDLPAAFGRLRHRDDPGSSGTSTGPATASTSPPGWRSSGWAPPGSASATRARPSSSTRTCPASRWAPLDRRAVAADEHLVERLVPAADAGPRRPHALRPRRRRRRPAPAATAVRSTARRSPPTWWPCTAWPTRPWTWIPTGPTRSARSRSRSPRAATPSWCWASRCPPTAS